MSIRFALDYFIAIDRIMTESVIFQLGADREQDYGQSKLDEAFYTQLHQNEIRYIRLKYGGRKSKQTERQLSQIIIDLVAAYTDCIDYFGAIGDASVAYFQAKIKEVNKYFQFLHSQIIQHYSPPHTTSPGVVVQREIKNDLGSISDQTGPQLLPEEDRQKGVVGKQALTQNLMVYLQTQDINTHIKQNLQKQQKINSRIEQHLKKQDEHLMRRQQKRRRNINRSRTFLSFSERNLNESRELSEGISQLMIGDIDMEALQLDSEEQLKALSLVIEQMKGEGE